MDESSLPTTDTGRGVGPLTILVVVVATILHLVVLIPFTVASGLVAPLWAMAVFYALWALGAVALVRTARRRPLLTPLVPVVNAGLLALGITLGETALGWTA